MAPRRKKPSSLQLAEFSDRELLHILLDVADNDGVAEAEAIANRIGIKHKNPISCVSARLSWLKRFGAVEKVEDSAQTRWKLTQAGYLFALGELTKEQHEILATLGNEHLVPVMRSLTLHYRKAGTTGGHLIRREWLYGSGLKR